MVHTGMRRSEAAGLRVRRVDLLRRRIEIVEQLIDVNGTLQAQAPKTDKSRRTITIPRFIAEMLAEEMVGKGPDDLVFTTPSGKPLRKANFRKRIWLPALREAGLVGLRIHDLRHTHVALLIAENEKPLAIANRIGHSDVAFTMSRYGHLMHGEDEALAERMERFAPGPREPDRTVISLDQPAI